MKDKSDLPENIDDYISGFPVEVHLLLAQVRAVIKTAAPEATEKISYQLPTFYLKGNLVHFGAFKKHIGLYPGASAISKFQFELADYQHAKGSIIFPYERPIPFALITEIVKFRVEENLAKAKQQPKKKKPA